MILSVFVLLCCLFSFSWFVYKPQYIWNSGVTGRGAECPPRDFWPGNFYWCIGKKEERKKGKRGKNWEEKKENCKREGGKLEMEVGQVVKRGEDLFFFFFFSLLKTTTICFGCTKMGIFYRGKKNSRREKNQEKWLCPLRKICLLRPDLEVLHVAKIEYDTTSVQTNPENL